MAEDQIPPTTKLAKNEYIQPLVIAFLASVFGFSYSFYYYGEFGRALALASIEFVFLFWIVLRGNKLVARRRAISATERLANAPMSASRLSTGRWLGVVAGIALIAAFIFTVGFLVRKQSIKAHALAIEKQKAIEKAADDSQIRKRTFQMYFWKECHASEERLRENIDAKIQNGTISVLSYKLNLPSGPAEIVYEGNANEARHIQETIRWTGIPSDTYGFVK